MNIKEVRLKDSVDPGISYSQSFLELEACHAAGLDMHKWESGGYGLQFKTRVLAWYNMHSLVEANVEDAKARAMEREAAKNRKK